MDFGNLFKHFKNLLMDFLNLFTDFLNRITHFANFLWFKNVFKSLLNELGWWGSKSNIKIARAPNNMILEYFCSCTKLGKVCKFFLKKISVTPL